MLNKRYIKESLLEFSKVAKDSEDLKKKANAMYNIAVIYDNGLGIKKDKNAKVDKSVMNLLKEEIRDT